MPNYETNFSNFIKLPNPGLRAYFGNVEKGQPEEYRTTFYKGYSLSRILSDWAKKLAVLEYTWPSLYEFEKDLGEKVGPLSIMKPLSERMDDIDAYYDSISLNQVPISAGAIDAVLREWKQVSGLRIRSQGRTAELMKKSTNSGSPYFTRRKNVLTKTIPFVINNYNDRSFQQVLPHRIYDMCAILGWRGQEGGPAANDVKQRVIWMFPFAANIAELQVYQPLIEASQRFDLVPAWVGMESVDAAITRLFDTKGPDDSVICTDFSKFDQHFNHTCQEAAELIIEALFAGDKSIKGWLDSVFPIKYNIPLAYDWNRIRYGAHGMASGSGGTNADETLVHRALQHEAARMKHVNLNPNSQCLGDDGILSFPGCNVKDVIRSYTRHGLEMNSSKQYVSTHDCVYLRRWHDTEYRIDGICVGVYSTLRALGRLCEQERYYDPDVWGPKMICLRELSIIENVKWHPLRNEFARFCMEGDKYRLGLDIPGFIEHLEDEAQKAIDYMPDFLGYTKSLQMDGGKSTKRTGINDWWIVKFLKSQR